MPPTTTAAPRRTFRAATPPDARCVPSARASQLIDHLLARQQDPPILEKKTGLPYGWAIWLRALSPLPRPLHARELIAVLLPRPLPASPGRLPQLTPWQAMRRLAWQQWDPAPRDQRWMRWTSAATSLLLHLLFAVLLLWVALVRTPQPSSEGGEGERMRVEFIGQGTQEGGGEQPGGDPAAAGASSAAAASGEVASTPPASATAAPSRSAQPSATPPAPAPAIPSPSPSPSPAETPAEAASVPPPPSPPLQATDVAEPTRDFVVPPISVPRTEVRVVTRDAVPQVREREVQVVTAPAPATSLPAPQVRVRSPDAPEVQVREREVSVPVEAPTPLAVRQVPLDVRVPEPSVREREVVTVTAPAITTPQVRSPAPVLRAPATVEPSVRERRVADAPPAPAPGPDATRDATSTSTTASASPDASGATTATGAASPAGSNAAASVPAQAGARPSPTPGNWATPARGDDWGASSRDTAGTASGATSARDAGQGSGLFNADGSVRVPGQEGGGDSERGAPGGDNDGWSRDRIAQSGTWLKRPPYDYTPTSFDKYWVPHESLLAEWVRRGVKSIEIPLPGTSTKISCVVSVLQFGGGCGLSDPNMQDQPATARPPPDIPFKKELQEGDESG